MNVSDIAGGLLIDWLLLQMLEQRRDVAFMCKKITSDTHQRIVLAKEISKK